MKVLGDLLGHVYVNFPFTNILYFLFYLPVCIPVCACCNIVYLLKSVGKVPAQFCDMAMLPVYYIQKESNFKNL
jgi:hypothetical protein